MDPTERLASWSNSVEVEHEVMKCRIASGVGQIRAACTHGGAIARDAPLKWVMGGERESGKDRSERQSWAARKEGHGLRISWKSRPGPSNMEAVCWLAETTRLHALQSEARTTIVYRLSANHMRSQLSRGDQPVISVGLPSAFAHLPPALRDI